MSATVTPKFGPNSMYLNGTSWLTTPSTGQFDIFATPCSIGMWCYPTNLTGGATLFGGGNPGDVTNRWVVIFANSTTVDFVTSGSIYGTGSATFNLNAWNYVMLTCPGTASGQKLYINGSLIFTTSGVNVYQGSPFWIGAYSYNTATYPFIGYIQEVTYLRGVQLAGTAVPVRALV